MKWLALIIVLILLIVSVRFRKLAVMLVLAGGVVGLLFWQYQDYEQNKSRNRIPPSQVILQNVLFDTSNHHYEMTGRIINHSDQYTLNGVQLKISVEDCKNDTPMSCIVFWATNEYIYITIPPKQARDFKKAISIYSDQNIEGLLRWNYSILYADSQ